VPKTEWDGSRWVRTSQTTKRRKPLEIECLDDLDRMLAVCEAIIARTDQEWSAVTAEAVTDKNPATRGSGHGFSHAGGQRRGQRRQRGATPSSGRYSGSAARPKGPGGAMNGRTSVSTPRRLAADQEWGSARWPAD